jgi:microcystin-dependent protein
MKKLILVLGIILSTQSFAQDCMIGEVKMFAGNFAPRGWAKLHGQLLPISSNSALFSILGTQFGGDGRTTFALPDMRGRAAIGEGNGPGLNLVRQGQKLGTETTTLSNRNMPNLSGTGILEVLMDTENTVTVAKTRGNQPGVKINVPERAEVQAVIEYTGLNEEFENRQPSLGMNYIICLQGYYPSRS